MFARVYNDFRGHTKKSVVLCPYYQSLQSKVLGNPNTKIRKRDSATLRVAASRPNPACLKSSLVFDCKIKRSLILFTSDVVKSHPRGTGNAMHGLQTG